jgi:caffeoyl-CoA O-methyltransferase
MNFIPENIQLYSEQHSSPESELLARLRRETHLNYLYPRMLSGVLQGRLLSMISKLVRPKRILEIGTYTGYAALCLAEGLPPEGILHTIELDPELKSIAERYLQEANAQNKVILHTGAALEIIPTLTEMFDLIFMDAEKYEYAEYFEAVLPKMPSGGLILADNVLWSGQVCNLEAQDKKTSAVRAFNQKIASDPRVEVILLPIRDGISLIRKL